MATEAREKSSPVNEHFGTTSLSVENDICLKSLTASREKHSRNRGIDLSRMGREDPLIVAAIKRIRCPGWESVIA